MSTSSELIRRIDFFQPLDDRLIDRIARTCINREYSPGDYIVRLGDPGLGLYVITRGSARVEIARDGAVLPIAELNAGEFVGELSIIDNMPRSASVVCNTDVSCILLTRNSFQTLLRKHPEIALEMVKTLASRLRTTDERMWQRATAVQEPLLEIKVPEAGAPEEAPPVSDVRKIKNALTDSVSWIYLLNSLTKFSVAVIGCPVNVSLDTRASTSFVTSFGPLKVVVVPSHEIHRIGVHAFGDGDFTATILQPAVTRGFTGVSVSRFHAQVVSGESTWLQLPALGTPETGPGICPPGVVRIPRLLHSGGGIRILEAALDF